MYHACILMYLKFILNAPLYSRACSAQLVLLRHSAPRPRRSRFSGLSSTRLEVERSRHAIAVQSATRDSAEVATLCAAAELQLDVVQLILDLLGRALRPDLVARLEVREAPPCTRKIYIRSESAERDRRSEPYTVASVERHGPAPARNPRARAVRRDLGGPTGKTGSANPNARDYRLTVTLSDRSGCRRASCGRRARARGKDRAGRSRKRTRGASGPGKPGKPGKRVNPAEGRRGPAVSRGHPASTIFGVGCHIWGRRKSRARGINQRLPSPGAHLGTARTTHPARRACPRGHPPSPQHGTNLRRDYNPPSSSAAASRERLSWTNALASSGARGRLPYLGAFAIFGGCCCCHIWGLLSYLGLVAIFGGCCCCPSDAPSQASSCP